MGSRRRWGSFFLTIGRRRLCDGPLHNPTRALSCYLQHWPQAQLPKSRSPSLTGVFVHWDRILYLEKVNWPFNVLPHHWGPVFGSGLWPTVRRYSPSKTMPHPSVDLAMAFSRRPSQLLLNSPVKVKVVPPPSFPHWRRYSEFVVRITSLSNTLSSWRSLTWPSSFCNNLLEEMWTSSILLRCNPISWFISSIFYVIAL